MENTENPRTITTFEKRERRSKQKSQMGTNRTTRRKRRIMKAKKDVVGGATTCGGGGGEDDKAEVERRIMALQRIVPGGESLGIDKLFDETAGYILALQCQVKAMKVLASFLEGLEKEKRKFGG